MRCLKPTAHLIVLGCSLALALWGCSGTPDPIEAPEAEDPTDDVAPPTPLGEDDDEIPVDGDEIPVDGDDDQLPDEGEVPVEDVGGEDLPADPGAGDPDVALAGTVWTESLPGSLGTYVTWYAFEPDTLRMIEELTDSYEQDEGILWSSMGDWNRTADGTVLLEWAEPLNDDSAGLYQRAWTYAPLTAPMIERVFDPTDLQPGEPWADTALISTDGLSTFRGTWEDDTQFPSWGQYQRRDVTVVFNGTISVDDQTLWIGDCQMTVKITAARGRTRDDAETGALVRTYECGVGIDDDTGLGRVIAMNFSGSDDEIYAGWFNVVSQAVDAGEIPSGLRSMFERGFLPALWFDLERPEVLAFKSRRPPLVSRTDAQPPAP